jgi:hypothetical protein
MQHEGRQPESTQPQATTKNPMVKLHLLTLPPAHERTP